MGAYREIETGTESCQRSQRGNSELSARFPAAVALLRPPTIPKLDSIMEAAWGRSPLPTGPNRETLISGLITLHGLRLVSDDDLLNVLNTKPNHLALWERVQEGFGRYEPMIGVNVVTAPKTLIADSFPIPEIVQRALEWFDLGAVSDDLMAEIAKFPQLMTTGECGYDVCNSFASTVVELSEAIKDYINTRFSDTNNAPNNSIEKRSQYLAEQGDTLYQSLKLFMPDFVVFQNGFRQSDVRKAYWRTFQRGLIHVQTFVMPMMTVDDLVDVVGMYDEERFYEVELVNTMLVDANITGEPTDEQISEILRKHERCFEYMQCVDDYRYAHNEHKGVEAIKNAWSPTNIKGFKDAHNFGRQIRTLPAPENSIEEKLRDWLVDLNRLLPKKKGHSTPLRELFDHAEHECMPFDNMYLIEFENNHLVNEYLERFYQGYMETGEENAFLLDWSLPASVVINVFENMGAMGRLFDQLECLSDSETPEADAQ